MSKKPWYNAGYALGSFSRSLWRGLAYSDDPDPSRSQASKYGARAGAAFRVGIRECLREIKHPTTASVFISSLKAELKREHPDAPIQADSIEALQRVPAIVRCKGIDLTQWFDTHTEALTPEESAQLELFPTQIQS